jgi:hypothetical protein
MRASADPHVGDNGEDDDAPVMIQPADPFTLRAKS